MTHKFRLSGCLSNLIYDSGGFFPIFYNYTNCGSVVVLCRLHISWETGVQSLVGPVLMVLK